jgi:hypothetical protein
VAQFKSKLAVPMPAPAGDLARRLGTQDNQALAASFARVSTVAAPDSPVVDA